MSELSPRTAQALLPVVRAAEGFFTRLPGVSLTSALRDVCGGDGDSDPHMLYCTDLNRIYVARLDLTEMGEDEMAYRLAHMYGHAVQVRHGIADRALATIRANRAREWELRTMVTQQVECIAGVILREAIGKRAQGPAAVAGGEAFTTSHWGASPVANGPRVSVGTAERESWFRKGRDAGDFAVCAAGEFSSDLILRALRP
ncbi:hypothetical protein [Algicella marina]|uniref:Uncharacterized protein n=1 Tax=Algicella marina TaxID=2683284 RepID=A0A6P1SW96_9RHOB|nr:hypothetical protein [Algicella marina]QHQ34944.1 hypothetical protein GO499_06905 [Algicella marina]